MHRTPARAAGNHIEAGRRALAALFGLHRRYGHSPFPLSGDHSHWLPAALAAGWVADVTLDTGPRRVLVTRAGADALAPYRSPRGAAP